MLDALSTGVLIAGMFPFIVYGIGAFCRAARRARREAEAERAQAEREAAAAKRRAEKAAAIALANAEAEKRQAERDAAREVRLAERMAAREAALAARDARKLEILRAQIELERLKRENAAAKEPAQEPVQARKAEPVSGHQSLEEFAESLNKDNKE